ncbi:MAG: tetratricopeptide repeat protein [Bryobacteraceae bacterium]
MSVRGQLEHPAWTEHRVLLANPDWRRLLRHFELTGQRRSDSTGALIIVLAPDAHIAERCRVELEGHLSSKLQQSLFVAGAATPKQLVAAASGILRTPIGDRTGAIWIEAVIGSWDPEVDRWRSAWADSCAKLNGVRDTMLSTIPVPVILVGAPWLVETLRLHAPDLWSVRTLVVRIERVGPPIKLEPEANRVATAVLHPARDPGFTLSEAALLRGKPGRERILVELLTRAGAGYRVRADWNKANAVLEEAVAVARAIRGEDGGRTLAIAINELASVKFGLGEMAEAMSLLKEQERLAIESGDRQGEQVSYGNQALILRSWGQFEEAMALLGKAQRIADEIGDAEGLQVAYGNQALVLQDQGRLDEAMALHKKEEALASKLGDRSGLIRTNANQSAILIRQGRLEEAMALLGKQEALAHELGDRAALLSAMGNRGLIFRAMGRLSEAMEIFQRQESGYLDSGDRAGLMRSYSNQALILRDQGKLDEALELHKQEESICEELGDIAGLAACYGNQAAVLQSLGQFPEAMALFQKQQAAARKLGDTADVARSLANQGALLAAMGKPSEARDRLAEAVRIFAEIGMPVEQKEAETWLSKLTTH